MTEQINEEEEIILKLSDRIRRSAKLKYYRKVMGMRSMAAAKLLKVDQPEYSKKENGHSVVKPHHLEIMRKEFEYWRMKEIKALNERIQFLKSIE